MLWESQCIGRPAACFLLDEGPAIAQRRGRLPLGKFSINAFTSVNAGADTAVVQLYLCHIAFKRPIGLSLRLWDAGHTLVRVDLSSSACLYGGTEVLR